MALTFPLWVSHSSMGDFLQCPKLYYYRAMYKDPKSKRKINIINPSLALGNAVHEVLESLSELPVEKRFTRDLLGIFETVWEKYIGVAGGFVSDAQELEYKNRGMQMLSRVKKNPGPLKNKAVKLHSDDDLPPRFFLSDEENIILCGKIDWLEYIPETDSVHIIDFKTGKHDEKEGSLQLPIYALLVKNCQKRNIEKMSYWYLEREDNPKEMQNPNLEDAKKSVFAIAMQIKQFRALGEFTCKRKDGCFACKPFEDIVHGKARFIRTSGYQDIYSLV